MRKLVLIFLTSVLLSAAVASAQTENAQVTGSVTFRERVALPPDAVIDVQLSDASVADIAGQTVAEVLINAEGRQVPVPFTLTYDPAKIDPSHRYSVRATIRSGDGMLMFSSTQAYPVLTHGAPSKTNLVLHTVGHGAKPGVAAKKQATHATSEAAAPASQAATPTTSESAAPESTTAAPTTPEPEKPAVQAETQPAESSSAAEPTTSNPPGTPSAPITPTEAATAPPEKKPTSAQTAAPAEPASPPAVSESTPASHETTPQVSPATHQPTPPAQPSPPAVAEAPTAAPESKPAEVPPSPSEPTTPPESKTEPTTTAPEANAAEPAAPLPEAPSATKRAELEAAPEAAEPDGESSSRPERPAANKALTPLADTQWKLIQLEGQVVVITPPQKPVTLAFSPEGRRIAGSAGCNSYLGTFTDDHGRLELHPGNMTMMMCADPAGTRERKFIAILRSADGYKISGDVLLLTNNGKTVAKFQNNQ